MNTTHWKKAGVGLGICLAGILFAGLAWAEENTPPETAPALAPTPAAAPEEPAATAVAEEPKPAGSSFSPYVRFSLGTGFAYYSVHYPNHGFRLWGAAISPEIVAGYAPIQNLTLTLGLTGMFLVEPDYVFRIGDRKNGIGDAKANAIHVGPGLTYTLPYDMTIGGSLNVGYIVFDLNGSQMEEAAETTYGLVPEPGQSADIPDATDYAYKTVSRHHVGFVLQAFFGKEWKVSEHAGIGLAAEYIFSVYPKYVSGKTEDAIRTGSIHWLGHAAILNVTATHF